ncbi:hypothetical protein M0R45_014515 [Rubus argutus]|uniref:Uncharacterized protein n=1 Tax=Rubus argutus TaxID=59490 RepID=A0AAW1XMT5_RUBAR
MGDGGGEAEARQRDARARNWTGHQGRRRRQLVFAACERERPSRLRVGDGGDCEKLRDGLEMGAATVKKMVVLP